MHKKWANGRENRARPLIERVQNTSDKTIVVKDRTGGVERAVGSKGNRRSYPASPPNKRGDSCTLVNRIQRTFEGGGVNADSEEHIGAGLYQLDR